MHLLGEFGPCRHGNQELGSDWVNGWMLVENLVASTSKKGHYVKVNGDFKGQQQRICGSTAGTGRGGGATFMNVICLWLPVTSSFPVKW